MFMPILLTANYDVSIMADTIAKLINTDLLALSCMVG